MIEGTDTSLIATQMQLQVNVKLPKGLLNADEFDRLLEKYSQDIAREARDFWIAEAGRRLKSSKRRYQDAIVLESVSGGGFTMSLNDPLAIAVETGAPGFDMKPGLMGKVVPMNLEKSESASYTPTFRTVTQQGKWKHPGWEARNIADAVIDEVTEVIIPKYIQKIVLEMVV